MSTTFLSIPSLLAVFFALVIVANAQVARNAVMTTVYASSCDTSKLLYYSTMIANQCTFDGKGYVIYNCNYDTNNLTTYTCTDSKCSSCTPLGRVDNQGTCLDLGSNYSVTYKASTIDVPLMYTQSCEIDMAAQPKSTGRQFTSQYMLYHVQDDCPTNGHLNKPSMVTGYVINSCLDLGGILHQVTCDNAASLLFQDYQTPSCTNDKLISSSFTNASICATASNSYPDPRIFSYCAGTIPTTIQGTPTYIGPPLPPPSSVAPKVVLASGLAVLVALIILL